MLTAGLGRVIAGKVGYGAACLLAVVVIVVSGYAHRVVGYANGFNDGVSTGNAPSTSAQAMNILVMGLESRTNFYGQALPPALITAMHTGPVGGQDPNTLILIHIFAGGQKAVGFSIPRDDLVDFPTPFNVQGINIPNGKIDNAYNWAYTESLAKTGFSDQARLPARQPGRRAGRDQDRRVGHRRAHRPFRRDQPGRVLLPGPGVRRRRGLPQAGGNRHQRRQLHVLEPVRLQLRVQRGEVRRLQPEEGRGPVPAPVGAPGARVRARARQPGRGRHRPHPPSAGRHRLRDLAAQARERVRRAAAPSPACSGRPAST